MAPSLQRFAAYTPIREQLLSIYRLREYFVTGDQLGRGSWGTVTKGHLD